MAVPLLLVSGLDVKGRFRTTVCASCNPSSLNSRERADCTIVPSSSSADLTGDALDDWKIVQLVFSSLRATKGSLVIVGAFFVVIASSGADCNSCIDADRWEGNFCRHLLLKFIIDLEKLCLTLLEAKFPDEVLDLCLINRELLFRARL